MIFSFFKQYQGWAGRSVNEILQLYSAHGQQQKLQRSSLVTHLHEAIKVKTFSSNVGITYDVDVCKIMKYSKTQKWSNLNVVYSFILFTVVLAAKCSHV